ncbi:hypothetical protein F901_00510 [Acinetobacter dispersus]|uniref:DUF4189 domain-containing protein n=1 Tax=Acinetobacter dispersus TaxID=70348 RepID=UPI0002D0A0CE|nr:DUF4189 domain-containing protein [Acinetobacter dispersus]ENX55664.1 hypothetical protein F901_00510 [Acinetobacter dispersus]
MIIRILFSLLLLFGLKTTSFAEGGCQAGYTPYNYGANIGCVPGGNDGPIQSEQQLPPPSPRPTGYWTTTWGAISFGRTSIAGVSTGMLGKDKAASAAILNCKAQGGRECAVALIYQNQCGVIAWGSSTATTARAGSITEASERAMQTCKEKTSDCQIYYSNCTQPIFTPY